jgi:two-component system, OmpR family, KDP operon response regulator KdpE
MTERRPSILLVEDNAQARKALVANLEGHGYSVRAAADGEEALVLWELRRPDLVLLDLGLPGIDGLGVLRRLRRDATTPVIVLSARGEERDKVEALDAGADDYLAKPFGMDELHARLRAAQRRTMVSAVVANGSVEIGRLRLDPTRRLVTVSDAEVRLTPREYELLKVLLAHAGRVVTSGRLLRAVWGNAYAAEAHYLHVYVGQIRRKIAAHDPDGSLRDLLTTEPGVGYRVGAPDEGDS